MLEGWYPYPLLLWCQQSKSFNAINFQLTDLLKYKKIVEMNLNKSQIIRDAEILEDSV